jgi:hypothetical protein
LTSKRQEQGMWERASCSGVHTCSST